MPVSTLGALRNGVRRGEQPVSPALWCRAIKLREHRIAADQLNVGRAVTGVGHQHENVDAVLMECAAANESCRRLPPNPAERLAVSSAIPTTPSRRSASAGTPTRQAVG